MVELQSERAGCARSNPPCALVDAIESLLRYDSNKDLHCVRKGTCLRAMDFAQLLPLTKRNETTAHGAWFVRNTPIGVSHPEHLPPVLPRRHARKIQSLELTRGHPPRLSLGNRRSCQDAGPQRALRITDRQVFCSAGAVIEKLRGPTVRLRPLFRLRLSRLHGHIRAGNRLLADRSDVMR
jgi:hypothetical protein